MNAPRPDKKMITDLLTRAYHEGVSEAIRRRNERYYPPNAVAGTFKVDPLVLKACENAKLETLPAGEQNK